MRRLLALAAPLVALAGPGHSAPMFVGLGDLAGGVFQSFAHRISGDGSTVVGSSESASGNEAFRWTSGGGMVGLGDLAGGSFESSTFGVSDDGSTVVGRGAIASGYEAFRWTSGGGMVGLGDLEGGSFESWAFGLSDDGSTGRGREPQHRLHRVRLRGLPLDERRRDGRSRRPRGRQLRKLGL